MVGRRKLSAVEMHTITTMIETNNTTQASPPTYIILRMLPERNWIYGLTAELIQSVDGEIRSAKIKAPNGRILHRPINKLYHMEIRAARSVSGTAILKESTMKHAIQQHVSKNGTEKLKSTNRRITFRRTLYMSYSLYALYNSVPLKLEDSTYMTSRERRNYVYKVNEKLSKVPATTLSEPEADTDKFVENE
uniref:DUF5641 domain-containing protein n=1 Tax=Heterorhabditis bacteriophora TaxID=37862 RepID=A0A1I7WFQ6_HETBA